LNAQRRIAQPFDAPVPTHRYDLVPVFHFAQKLADGAAFQRLSTNGVSTMSLAKFRFSAHPVSEQRNGGIFSDYMAANFIRILQISFPFASSPYNRWAIGFGRRKRLQEAKSIVCRNELKIYKNKLCF
jgi:hypothetical protein